jgi:hypothetical protein
MHVVAWVATFGVVAVVAVAQGQARVAPNAKTFVYRGRTQVGYVQRVPADGKGVWSGLVLSQSVGSSGASLIAYCNLDGVVYREGIARRRSLKRWVVWRLQPQEGLAGHVLYSRADRWSITNETGRRIASAKGPDGPAGGLALLSICT